LDDQAQPCGPGNARFVLVEIGEQTEQSHGMLATVYSRLYHERVVGILVKHELGILTYADLKMALYLQATHGVV